jgi:hypothetical protein
VSAFRQPLGPQPDPWYERLIEWLFARLGIFVIVALILLAAFWLLIGYVAWHFLGRYW